MTMITISDDDLIEPPVITRGSWMETVNEIHGIYPLRITTEPQPIFTNSFAVAGAIFLEQTYSDLSVVVFTSEGVSWAKAYHIEAVNRFSYAYGITEVSDGLIVGGNLSVGIFNHNAILKVSKTDGSIIWSTILDQGNADEYISSVKETSDGGIICTSRLRRGGANYDIGLIKLTSSGTVSWAKYYDGTSDDYGRKVIELSSGDLLICGTTDSLAENNILDALIIKLNSSGTVSWAKKYNKTGTDDNEFFNDIKETSDGGFIAIGYVAEALVSFQYDIIVVKTTSDGTISWSTRVTANSSYGDRDGYKIREVSDGYVFVGYYANDISITKINTSGVWQWSKQLKNSSNTPMFNGDTSGLVITDDGIAFAGLGDNAVTVWDLLVGYIDFNGDLTGCSYLSDITPTVEAGNITATSVNVTMAIITIEAIEQTVTELPKTLSMNKYCTNDPYFAMEISTDVEDSSIEPYDMIVLD